MTVFEHAGRLLIVDCGVLFPDEHQPGVDVILPDFTWIRDRLDKVDAIVLTHGHEDHIGGVPYLLRERPDIPVVGSRLTLAFIEAKLDEHRIKPRTVEVAEGDRRTFGPFDCEFVAVNHSIPDGLAVAIRTAAGLVLHTGDFKMDQFPLDGRVTDLRAFARLGEEGVDLFLVDSTNAEVPGFTDLRGRARARRSTRSSAPPRAASSSPASPATCTASSRSSTPPTGTAARSPSSAAPWCATWASPASSATSPSPTASSSRTSRPSSGCAADQIAIIGTGLPGRADGRPGPHGQPRPPGRASPRATRCCMASSLIPGNENAIYRVINELTRWGANVVHKGNAKVHVSGHASAGELAYCYNIIQPTNVLPVHGEWRHLRANADIAIRTGVDADRVLIAAGRQRHRPRRRAREDHRQRARRASSTSTR